MRSTPQTLSSTKSQCARVFLLAVWLASALLAGAARPTTHTRPRGKLRGVVVTPDGKPVAHARVILQGAEGSHPHAARADRQGQFSFPALRQGYYEVRAQAQGLSSEWQHNVGVRAGQEVNLTLRLRPKEPPPDPPKKSPAKPASR
jgi:hypothetical protein